MKPEHAQEVLRIAALLALATEDVSPVEREVLGKIAKATGLGAGAVDQALSDVKAALASAGS
jgi:tellurite resistance protein